MMPVSTVNASNYHLLGNQLKGESHSKRIKRDRATANMNAFSPTLQPLGAMADSVNQLAGPLFLAVLVGAGVGATRKSKNKGIKKRIPERLSYTSRCNFNSDARH
mgnify:CR=1 FL=1